MSPDGASIRLTPTEWQVLEVLARNEGKLVGQRQLLQEVWGPAYETETNYLRVYLAQLRQKLEPDPAAPAPPADRARDGLPPRDRARAKRALDDRAVTDDEVAVHQAGDLAGGDGVGRLLEGKGGRAVGVE